MLVRMRNRRPFFIQQRGGKFRIAATGDERIAPPPSSTARPLRAPACRKLRHGAAAVELAIVLPVLVTVLFGATDFGRFSYSSIAVGNAARSGAAFGIMNPFDASSQAAWQAAVQQAAIDELSASSAFDTSQLTVTITTTDDGGGLRRVSVQTTYPFTTLVNWPYIPHTFNLSQTIVMRGLR
jgi:Flp pilus assembly protein TadG